MATLTNFPGTDMPPRMGRKPLGVKETKMRLPIGLPERINVLAGDQKRADFIRKALILAVRAAEKEAGIEPPATDDEWLADEEPTP